MANKEVPALTSATLPLDGVELMHVVKGGNSRQTSIDAVVWSRAMVHRVLSLAQSGPPGAPVAGDRYIVAAPATGSWTGHENKLAVYDGTNWYFIAPSSGMIAYGVAEALFYTYGGSSWDELSLGGGGGGGGDQYTELSFFCGGEIGNGETIFRYVPSRDFELPAGMADSTASAGVAATASTVLSIRKNGVEIGTITFAAGSSTGVYALSLTVTFTAGTDVLTIVGPATADATLADVAISMTGDVT